MVERRGTHHRFLRNGVLADHDDAVLGLALLLHRLPLFTDVVVVGAVDLALCKTRQRASAFASDNHGAGRRGEAGKGEARETHPKLPRIDLLHPLQQPLLLLLLLRSPPLPLLRTHFLPNLNLEPHLLDAVPLSTAVADLGEGGGAEGREGVGACGGGGGGGGGPAGGESARAGAENGGELCE